MTVCMMMIVKRFDDDGSNVLMVMKFDGRNFF
jgi:hypothetical protein